MLERMLLNNTADIKLSNDSQFTSPFASGTGEAVHGGAIYMVAAAIDRIVADMGVAAGTRPEVVITGGDAGQIQSLLSASTRHEPQLVLNGLAILVLWLACAAAPEGRRDSVAYLTANTRYSSATGFPAGNGAAAGTSARV